MSDAVEQVTVEQVRFAFIDRRDFEAQVAYQERPTDADSAAAFDAWLAEHDAQVKARALTEAADALPAETPASPYTADWLRARAAQEEDR